LVGTPIIELDRPGRGVVRHRRGRFEMAAALQVGGDPGGAEGVVADRRLDAGGQRGEPFTRPGLYQTARSSVQNPSHAPSTAYQLNFFGVRSGLRFIVKSYMFPLCSRRHIMSYDTKIAERFVGSPGSLDGDPRRPQLVQEMVGNLRKWLAKDFPDRLPPSRDDPEAALRELLDLLIDAAPKELVMYGATGLEALDDLPMSAHEIAMAYFRDDEIVAAFDRLERRAGLTAH